MNIKLHFAAALIAALICFASCGSGDVAKKNSAPVLDLMDRWSLADSSQPEEHFKQSQLVTRKGLRRQALVLVAPVHIHAPLRGFSGRATLRGWAAPVYNIGDGLQMNLFVRRNGIRHQVGSRYIDSGKNAGDRDWIPIEILLEIGEDDWLEIEISGGRQGNLVADWLALSELGLFQSRIRANP
jgi:hypothetical protein